VPGVELKRFALTLPVAFLAAGLLGGPVSAQETAPEPTPETAEKTAEKTTQGTGSETLVSPRLVDRIVAVVDEEAILLSDLEREIETYHFELQSAGQPETETDAEVRQQMLDRLIEVKLLVAQAKLDGMVIGDEELERETAQATQRLIDRFGTRAALDRELARSGMTFEDLEARNRELVRNRLYTMRMVQRYVRPKIEVRDDEVQAFYEEHKDEVPRRTPEVTIGNILVVPQPDASVMDAIDVKLADIDAALKRGDSFEEVARKYSQGPNASRGGLVGRFDRGDLFSPVIEEALWTMSVGEISPAINTEIGIHVLQLVDRDETSVNFRQILVRVDISEEDQEAARARAREVVQKARSGQDFATLATQYSDDPGSRENGGLLGTFPVDKLSEQFQTALRGMEVGEVTDPVEGAAGLFILKLMDKGEGEAYSYEELEENMRSAVFDQKLEAELNVFLTGLHDRFYIEIKA
jgi:peptidyl-prolyl cis-trans isomerase SurA